MSSGAWAMWEYSLTFDKDNLNNKEYKNHTFKDIDKKFLNLRIRMHDMMFKFNEWVSFDIVNYQQTNNYVRKNLENAVISFLQFISLGNTEKEPVNEIFTESAYLYFKECHKETSISVFKKSLTTNFFEAENIDELHEKNEILFRPFKNEIKYNNEMCSIIKSINDTLYGIQEWLENFFNNNNGNASSYKHSKYENFVVDLRNYLAHKEEIYNKKQENNKKKLSKDFKDIDELQGSNLFIINNEKMPEYSYQMAFAKQFWDFVDAWCDSLNEKYSAEGINIIKHKEVDY